MPRSQKPHPRAAAGATSAKEGRRGALAANAAVPAPSRPIPAMPPSDTAPAFSANPTGSSGSGWLSVPGEPALTSVQERQLDALFGRILPADAGRGVPGAVRAGASRFVSQLLARDASVYEEIPEWREAYPKWLSALDEFARARLGAPLIDLAPEKLDALLAGLEAATLAELPPSIDQKKVFKTLYRHCIQGCFSDPRWGGNAERVMWRWFGYLQPAEDV